MKFSADLRVCRSYKACRSGKVDDEFSVTVLLFAGVIIDEL